MARPAVRRDWASLPALGTAVGRRAPLIAATGFGHDVAGARPMVARRGSTAGLERPIGTVGGVVIALARPSIDPPAPRLGAPSALPELAHPRRPVSRDDEVWLEPPEPVVELAAPVASIDLRDPPPDVADVRPSEPDGARRPPSMPGTPSPPPAPTGAAASETRPRAQLTLAESRRLGLGPAYHGALPEALPHLRGRAAAEHAEPAPATEATDRAPGPASPGAPPLAGSASAPAPAALPSARPAPAPTLDEPVPDDVRATLRHAFGGEDPGPGPVRRGPEVTEEAARRSARAYTRDGQVFVPAHEGPLHQPHVKGIVAHELTHLVQQRRAPGGLPPEDSPAGRRLEAAAQIAERHARGDPGAPAPSPRLLSAEEMMADLIANGAAVADGRGGVVFPPPPASGGAGAGPGVQRLVEPAGPSDRDRWGRQSAANPFATFVHDLGEDVMATFEEVAASSFGLSDDVVTGFDRSRQNREARFQAEAGFRTQRLQHLRGRRLGELTEAARNTTPGASEVHELPPNERSRIDEQIDREVRARVAQLDARVQARIAELNRDLDRGQRPFDELEPARYAHVANVVFAHPDLATVPDDDTRDTTTAAARRAEARAERSGEVTGPTPAGTASATSTGGGTGVTTAGTGSTGTAATAAGLGGAGRRSGSTGFGPPGGDSRDTRPTPPEFSSWRDIGDALTLDAAGFATDAWGISLTRAEQRQLTGHTAVTDDRPEWAEADRREALETHRRTERERREHDEMLGIHPSARSGERGHAAQPSAQPLGTRPEGQRDVSPSGHEQLDLDHLDISRLAQRLYPELSRRLRDELRTGRERSGRGADTS